MSQVFKKDPNARLDYTFNLARWLDQDEVIVDRTVTAEAGLTLEARPAASSISADGKRVTEWISGGTLGTSYKVNCRFTTSVGRIDEDTIIIRCVDK